MRRRPPHTIELSRPEAAFLRELLADGRTEQRVARRARILLAMSDALTGVADLAERCEQTRFAIWHLCRRFEEHGVAVVYDAYRTGRRRTISPSGARRNRAISLL
jgi:hypothetical protein